MGLIIFGDQFSKSLASSHTIGQTYVILIPGIIQFTLLHNTGAAWGMLGEWTNMFVIVALIVCILIVIYLFVFRNSLSNFMLLGLAFLFAGGIGNAIDRVINGYVIDFIDITLINFPIFNIADMAVTAGVIFLIINYLFIAKKST